MLIIIAGFWFLSVFSVSVGVKGVIDVCDMDRKHVYKLVLTGGPCSGKTTALEELKTFLTKHGYKVFTTPEAATTLFLNGCSIADFSVPNAAYTFQIGVLTYVTSFLRYDVLLPQNTSAP